MCFIMNNKINLKRKDNSLTIAGLDHSTLSSQQRSAGIHQNQCSDKFCKILEKTPALEPFFFFSVNRIFKKRRSSRMFSYKFCKNFNNFFYRTAPDDCFSGLQNIKTEKFKYFKSKQCSYQYLMSLLKNLDIFLCPRLEDNTLLNSPYVKSQIFTSNRETTVLI